MRISFTVATSSVLGRMRTRRDNVVIALDAATVRLADYTNHELIPQFYPGAAAKAIVAHAEPYRRTARITALTFHKTSILFDWFEYGVKPHEEPGPEKKGHVMSFEWERMGGAHVAFTHINHPGFIGRQRLPQMREPLRARARQEWQEAIATALRSGG